MVLQKRPEELQLIHMLLKQPQEKPSFLEEQKSKAGAVQKQAQSETRLRGGHKAAFKLNLKNSICLPDILGVSRAKHGRSQGPLWISPRTYLKNVSPGLPLTPGPTQAPELCQQQHKWYRDKGRYLNTQRSSSNLGTELQNISPLMAWVGNLDFEPLLPGSQNIFMC